MRWEVLVERRTVNRLNDEICKKHLRDIAGQPEKYPALGFSGKAGPVPEPDYLADGGEPYRYRARLRLEENGRGQGSPELRLEKALGLVRKAASAKGWRVVAEEDGAGRKQAGVRTGKGARPPFVPPALDESALAAWFDGVYEREAHVRLVHDATLLYAATGGEMRTHTLLFGKPGAAKTTVFRRFKGWYDSADGVERVAFVNATSLAKAGLENWLLERAAERALPEILWLEEIEKNRPEDMLCLLSVMDESGQLQKTNARIGQVTADVRVLVWATCNDLELLKRFRNGALFSRFQCPLRCVRPSPELMWCILYRELGKIPGAQPSWAERAWRFAYETLPAETGRPLDDPRAVIGLLGGRERLVDGSYQEDRLAVLRAEAEEESRDRELEEVA
jgi:hypothetical protein